jgi:adenylate cyclase
MSSVVPGGGPVERRLTAILSADVVGYSRLMGEDEAATLTALKKHKAELIDPKAFQYGGRIIKLMGDGVLMEFGSVVDAVSFAVEMQGAMRDRNAELPEQRQILYRVGINTGDVIVEGDDIYGDGVNVAARLEGLAEPGGICVARYVHDQVRGKLDLHFDDLGDIDVKNIASPVRAFRVAMDEKASALKTPIVPILLPVQRRAHNLWGVASGIAILLLLALGAVFWNFQYQHRTEPTSAAQLAQPPGGKPSIVVLPFLNIAGDANQQPFADGISDDLTTQLSKISGLFVISRMTASKYRGRSGDVRQLAGDLGVRYVLEGSVRRGGERLRINAQLVDATTGGHLWAETFNGPIADSFALQDRINARIIAALKIKLTPEEAPRVQYRGTENVEAYDAFLRAERYRSHGKRSKFLEAIPNYNRAIELDPNFGSAYAGLGHALWRRFRFARGYGFREDLLRAQEMTRRAVALGENVLTSMLLAKMDLFDNGDHAHAERLSRTAVAKDPNNAESLVTLAEVLLYSGQLKEADRLLKQAMRLNPSFPFSYSLISAQISFENRKYNDVINTLDETCKGVTSFFYIRPCDLYAGSSHGYLGNIELGQKKVDRIGAATLSPEQKLNTIRSIVSLRFPFKKQSSEDHLLTGIQKVLMSK